MRIDPTVRLTSRNKQTHKVTRKRKLTRLTSNA